MRSEMLGGGGGESSQGWGGVGVNKSLIMFDDMFDTAEELLSGQKQGNVQSFWERLPRSCADSLPLPELTRNQGYPIGLKNQGATCYLNSLFQLLFHTPELRHVLLQLPLCLDTPEQPTEFVSKNRHGFLLGLQRLFAEMALCDQRAVATDYLKKAFGWEHAEHIQQQDIQEAMRIIFDTIERALFGTPQHELIRSLFKGTTQRYKTCRNCGETSEHPEEFYDLQLQVISSRSVEEAILALTTAESMEGDNAISCEICASKQNHWLGTRLNDLPLTLVLTFNRFDFDFEKMDRVKLNSLFQFQLELDLAPHLPHQHGIDFGYELYGVIIHRGSAHGGHYYCYARDLMRESDWTAAQAKEKQRKDKKEEGKQEETKQEEDSKKQAEAKKEEETLQARREYLTQGLKNPQLLEGWFEINDSTATAVDVDQLTRKFEGSDSAYILFYRRRNLALPQMAEVPAYFRSSILAANLVMQQERQVYEFEKQHIVLTIDQVSHKLPITTTLASFLTTYVPEGNALVLESVHNGLPYYPLQIINSTSNPYPPEATLSSAEVYHESRWKTYPICSPEYASIKGCIGKDRLPMELVLLEGDNARRVVCFQDENFLMLRVRIEKEYAVPYEMQQLTLVTPYKQLILTDSPNDDVLLPKAGLTHGAQLVIRSLGVSEQPREEQKQSHLLCFLIERDDVVGLKRLYFEKTKTLQALFDFFTLSENIPTVRHRFRNLSTNRLFYQEHYAALLGELDLNEEMVRLRMERGDVPVKGDVSVKVKLQSLLGGEGRQLERVFDPNALLGEVKSWACEQSGLAVEQHKLYLTDWMGEPVRSLTRENHTLFQLNFGREEVLCLRDLQSPIGAELVHLQIFTTATGSPDSVERESNHVKIEEFKTVGELRQVLVASLPWLEGVSVGRLRLREIKRDHMFGSIWRDDAKTVKNATINSTKLVLQVLAEEERLSEDQIVVLLKRRDPVARVYGPAVELIFEAGKSPSAEQLIEAVKGKVGQEGEVRVVKYVHYNFEWVEISRQGIENLAKGKKPKKEGKKKEGKKEPAKEDSKKEEKKKEEPATQIEAVEKPKETDKKGKKQKKGGKTEPTTTKPPQDFQNLRRAPILLKDGDWLGWGPSCELQSDDFQTAQDISLRGLKDSRPVKYKGKEQGGFRLNVQF